MLPVFEEPCSAGGTGLRLLMLPTVLLTRFMFPWAERPFLIYVASFGNPTAYFLEILRNIILRGADFADLLP